MGTRELTAADYVYEIKRLDHPRLECPLFSTMAKYILGLEALAQDLQGELNRIRTERRKEKGALYDPETRIYYHRVLVEGDVEPADEGGSAEQRLGLALAVIISTSPPTRLLLLPPAAASATWASLLVSVLRQSGRLQPGTAVG
mgnify:CR=1 FL=1